MKALTKPQASFLFRAMERPRPCFGSDYRVVGNLRAAELVEEAGRDTLFHALLFRPTRLGLEALAYYWMCKDAASGCPAYVQRRREVEEALAARFPEPVLKAA
jgi:hypothetical protein